MMEKMGGGRSVDLIWDEIEIEYGGIIGGEGIMYVSDEDEMMKEVKKAG